MGSAAAGDGVVLLLLKEHVSGTCSCREQLLTIVECIRTEASKHTTAGPHVDQCFGR